MRTPLILCMLALPLCTHAAVVISEIAWMGSSDSANDEWIELYNTGSEAVGLDGWVLTDGASLEIPLSGSIASNAYAVLERTDEGSAPGTAFLVYTGALANTGSTLSLYRTDGSLEDRVAGGENWENIGGDNITKHTAQLTASGWRTAEPSPGKAASVSAEEDSDNDNEADSEDEEDDRRSPGTEDKPVTIELQAPDVTLSLQMLVPEIAYVNQNIVFDVVPSGIGKTQLNSLTYMWNFGDLETKTGKETKHAYAYPGEYVVTLYATFGRHEQVARKTIAVLPVTFSLSSTEQGDVLLQNNAKYEINVSGFTLQGERTLTFPPRSIILANGSLTLPGETIGDGPFILLDQKGVLVASSLVGAREEVSPVAREDEAIMPAVSRDSEPVSSNFSFVDEVVHEQHTTAEPVLKNLAQLTASEETETAVFMSENLPLLGLCLIVTLGIIAVLLSRKKEDLHE